MALELHLPLSLWRARDAAIGGLQSSVTDTAAERELETWVVEHGEAAFYEFGDAALGTMHYLEAEESEVRDRLEINPETAVTDEDRAAYLRLKVEDARAEFYGPFLEGYPISDCLGNIAVLAAKSYCCGQGGWEFEWFGLFPTREAAIKRAVDQGFFIDSWVTEGKRMDEHTDQELIAFIIG
jgi:hypothetical protein